MAQVRILRAWRGAPSGVFAEVLGKALKEGLTEGAVDDKVTPDEVPDAEVTELVIGEDEKAAAAAKPANSGK